MVKNENKIDVNEQTIDVEGSELTQSVRIIEAFPLFVEQLLNIISDSINTVFLILIKFFFECNFRFSNIYNNFSNKWNKNL